MCRRCGTHLPLEMGEHALPTRAALKQRLATAAGRTQPRPGPNDTLLPHNQSPPRPGDNLVPRRAMPTAAKRGAAGAAAAAGLAGLVTLRRVLRRR